MGQVSGSIWLVRHLNITAGNEFSHFACDPLLLGLCILREKAQALNRAELVLSPVVVSKVSTGSLYRSDSMLVAHGTLHPLLITELHSQLCPLSYIRTYSSQVSSP